MKTHILLIVVTVALLVACRPGAQSTGVNTNWEEDQKRYRVQLDDFDRQSKRADDLQTKMEEHNRRFDKLLDKWEEQARRQDAILDAQERQQKKQ